MSTPGIRTAVDERRGRALVVSRSIHAEPELALREHHASAVLQGWLADEGFAVTTDVAGLETAFVGEWGTGGPRIAVMAEYDALPGIGHACGHNLIASGGLLAAAAVRAELERTGTPGRVVVIGTPGEEGAGGKVIELAAGVFDDVDAAMMFHPADRTILTRRMLACLHFDVHFHGVAAHAAKNPQDGRNALAAMLLFFTGVDALRQHSGDGSRMHGIIAEGGEAPNVVPEYTRATFIVRDVTLERAEALAERVYAVARGAAEATGTTTRIEETSPPYAHLHSNQAMAARVGVHLAALGVDHEPPSPTDGTGSTDAGNVSLAVPTVHPFMQIAERGTPSHSRVFADAAATPRAEEAMVNMATALAGLAWDLFTQPDLLAAATEEFRATTAPAALEGASL